MIVNCPHCTTQLKLNEGVIDSLKKLPEGKSLKVQCVSCEETFALTGSAVMEEEETLVFDDAPPPPPPKMEVRPPAPPKMDWLTGGEMERTKNIEGVPRALVLFPEGDEKSVLVDAVEDLGYQVETAGDVDEALSMMYFVSYSLVFFHQGFEGGGLESSEFHRYICGLPMTRRRHIFYILVGDDRTTMYDLEALSLSVNLTLNTKDIKHISLILRRMIPEYEDLFGGWMEELRLAGK